MIVSVKLVFPCNQVNAFGVRKRGKNITNSLCRMSDKNELNQPYTRCSKHNEGSLPILGTSLTIQPKFKTAKV